MADVKYSEFTAALDTVTPTTSDNIVINDDSDSGLPKAATIPSIKTLFEDLTTKGDLLVYSTEQTRLPVGTDDYVLTADSSEATGLKWAEASGGDGWDAVSDTWTYTSATTITVPSGAASIYSIGDKIKLTQTTVKYFYVVGVADTLLTVTGGSDYAVANAAITSPYYSHVSTPVGFPEEFNFVPNAQGFSSAVTESGSFSMVGAIVFIKVSIYGTTSNATTLSFTSPFALDTTYKLNGLVTNPTLQTVMPLLEAGTGTTVNIYKDGAGTAWAASGSKGVILDFRVSI